LLLAAMIVNVPSIQQYGVFPKKWLMDNINVKRFYTHWGNA